MYQFDDGPRSSKRRFTTNIADRPERWFAVHNLKRGSTGQIIATIRTASGMTLSGKDYFRLLPCTVCREASNSGHASQRRLPAYVAKLVISMDHKRPEERLPIG